MEKNEEVSEQGKDSSLYYVIGAIVLVLVIGVGYVLRTKPGTQPPQVVAVPTPTSTPGPITKLGCDMMYYNPVVGFSKYYLSAEGGDLTPAKKVNCEFTVTVAGKEVAKSSAEGPLSDAPQRGGMTFRCTTKGVEVTAGVPAVVDVVLKDDAKASASCSSTFLFPAP